MKITSFHFKCKVRPYKYFLIGYIDMHVNGLEEWWIARGKEMDLLLTWHPWDPQIDACIASEVEQSKQNKTQPSMFSFMTTPETHMHSASPFPFSSLSLAACRTPEPSQSAGWLPTASGLANSVAGDLGHRCPSLSMPDSFTVSPRVSLLCRCSPLSPQSTTQQPGDVQRPIDDHRHAVDDWWGPETPLFISTVCPVRAICEALLELGTCAAAGHRRCQPPPPCHRPSTSTPEPASPHPSCLIDLIEFGEGEKP